MAQTHSPIRCFEGNAKPHEAFWTWKDKGDSTDNADKTSPDLMDQAEPAATEPELELYGYISEYSWFEDDVTPKMFKDDLYNYGKGGPITVRINSYGGDVVAASLIHTMIDDYPGRVTVQIDGVAASAATVVAVAGDVVRIQETGYFMIHDPAFAFFLEIIGLEEMERLADALQAVKEGIVNAYETKTGLSRARLAKLMTDETWMDARKAVDLGFVDEILKQEKKLPITIPQNAAVVNALKNFNKVPDAILDAVAGRNAAPVQLSEDEQREADALRDRVSKLLKKE